MNHLGLPPEGRDHISGTQPERTESGEKPVGKGRFFGHDIQINPALKERISSLGSSIQEGASALKESFANSYANFKRHAFKRSSVALSNASAFFEKLGSRSQKTEQKEPVEIELQEIDFSEEQQKIGEIQNEEVKNYATQLLKDGKHSEVRLLLRKRTELGNKNFDKTFTAVSKTIPELREELYRESTNSRSLSYAKKIADYYPTYQKSVKGVLGLAKLPIPFIPPQKYIKKKLIRDMRAEMAANSKANASLKTLERCVSKNNKAIKNQEPIKEKHKTELRILDKLLKAAQKIEDRSVRERLVGDTFSMEIPKEEMETERRTFHTKCLNLKQKIDQALQKGFPPLADRITKDSKFECRDAHIRSYSEKMGEKPEETLQLIEGFETQSKYLKETERLAKKLIHEASSPLAKEHIQSVLDRAHSAPTYKEATAFLRALRDKRFKKNIKEYDRLGRRLEEIRSPAEAKEVAALQMAKNTLHKKLGSAPDLSTKIALLKEELLRLVRDYS